MTRIVITDGFAVNPGDLSWDGFRKYGELTAYDKLRDDEAAEALRDAECVFTNRVKIGREVLDACPHIRFVSAMGTGYDMIDVPACTERGVNVCNVPGYSTDSVAQTAFTLLLANAFDLEGYRNIVREGKWTGLPGFRYQQYRFCELSGKTAGVYGCGAIGKKFGRICQSFGMNVLGSRRSKTEGTEDGIRYCTPDELLASSDYISFHCPLTDETRGMVNREMISKMKDGAVIINTSRGAVLNEEDVAEALRSGKLGGLGADVLSKEPPDPDHPLLSAPNAVITPHCAWTSREARLRLVSMLEDNLASFLETGRGRFCVN